MQQQAVSQEVIDAPTVVQGEELPFEEAELAVDNLREMLSSTRMLRMDDLIVNGAETPDEAYDISELGSRCDVLKSELKRLADYMVAWLKANGGKDNAASLSKEAVMLGIEHLLGAFRHRRRSGYSPTSPAAGCFCAGFNLATRTTEHPTECRRAAAGWRKQSRR